MYACKNLYHETKRCFARDRSKKLDTYTWVNKYKKYKKYFKIAQQSYKDLLINNMNSKITQHQNEHLINFNYCEITLKKHTIKSKKVWILLFSLSDYLWC